MSARVRSGILLVALLACVEPEGAPPLLQEGDPCRSWLALCLDDDYEQTCVDHVWTVQSCEAHCAELGPELVPAGCERGGGCQCTSATEECTPGALVCASSWTLQYCDDSRTWVDYDCQSLCDERETTPLSLGCVDEGDGASCLCTSAGWPCADFQEGDVHCATEDILLRCEQGVWTLIDCANEMGPGARCRTRDGVAACEGGW